MKHLLIFLMLAAVGWGELRIPDRIEAGKLDLSGGTLAATIIAGGTTAIMRHIGDTVAIASTSTDAGATVDVNTSANHGLIVGNYVTIAGTTSYNAEYQVTVIVDADTFTIAETNSEGSETGTFTDSRQDSPIGSAVLRYFIPATSNTVLLHHTFASAKNVYPNLSWVWKFETSGTDAAPTNLFFYVAQAASTLNYHRTPTWNAAYTGWTSGQWNFTSNRRYLMTTSGSVADWCTTQENQAYAALRHSAYFNFTFGSDAVYYMGGLSTVNQAKAKVIFTFDDFHSTVESYALPAMRAKGWEGAVAVKGDAMDASATTIARVQTMSDAGWDIINHSFNHYEYDGDPTLTNNELILQDLLLNKTWLTSEGWTRGTKFLIIPFLEYQSLTGDIGDVLENHFFLTFGANERARYGNTQRNGSLVTNSVSPYIPDDFTNIGRCSDASSTSAAAYTAGSTLHDRIASAVLTRGVVIVMMHSIYSGADDSYGNSEAWFEEMIADVATYEAAGTLEVVTVSDWYGELTSLDLSESVTSTGTGNRTTTGGTRYDTK